MTINMDYQFPRQLFPSFYNCGPPDSVLKHCAGSWGCYDRVRPQGRSGPLSSWTFTSRHQVRGETWRHIEPVPVPLLSPKKSVLWPSTPPDPLDFTEHMQNFFMDHCHDAFGCMGEILAENFNFKRGQREKYRKDSVHMWKVKNTLDMLQFKICHRSYSSRTLDAYSALLSDVVHAVPPELLGSLLHEELTEQRDRLLFCEGATGGALAFVPFSRGSSGSQRGCLLYPGNQGLDSLNFHRVELKHHRGSCSCVDAGSSPFSFQLKGPVRQISSASLLNDCCAAVRSDHLCGVWRFSERNEPRLLQVVSTEKVATCIGASPHVLGEILVASESGGVNLWTVGRGMQKVREEEHNLYFNANSSWRWCEFSAHPRVMLYADRTGVELTDIRVTPVLGHTLFRISSTSECRRGERLILSRYLGDVHPFHHLVTTQHSAYIVDERFPGVPMLKWDHMMRSPPIFCHVVPGSGSGSAVGGAGATKVLLGSHSSQEVTLLQYSGGRAEACFSQGPPQALFTPRDSLKHLPVQIPHRLDIATDRLSSPVAGLTCIQKQEGREAGGEQCICVLQLTEAGDIFYQILEPEPDDASRPPAAEDGPRPTQAARTPPQPALSTAATSGAESAQRLQPDSQPTVSDTSSSEDVIGPTQGPGAQRLVAETPEREQRALNIYSDSSSEDSESAGRRRHRKQLWLQVVVNDDPEPDQASGLKDGRAGEISVDEETVGGSRPAGPPERRTPVRLSGGALVTWKRWLQKLMRKSREKKPRPRRLQHPTVETEGLLHLPDDKARDPAEEACVRGLRRGLRRDLSACMARRSLLVHGTVSASLGAPDAVPMPNTVDTEAWADQLSRRLTLSWQGEEAWHAWWEDRLGLNREEKVEALRRKRRREKEARRASGRRLELSGSFTSSVSYQSELDDFSNSTGWSSAASQGAWSDAEGPGSQGLCERRAPRAGTPSTVQSDTPVYVATGTPQSVRPPSSSRTPSLSHTPKPAVTQRGDKRPAEDDLSALFASQGEHSQPDSCFLEEGIVHPSSPPVASSSQLRSPLSVPWRGPRVDLSQDASVRSALSQSSQGRLGLSQASQPQKKKKSRMGF